MPELSPFQIGYLTCALWASDDDEGNPLDGYAIIDIAPDSLARMCAECDAFEAAHGNDLDAILPRVFRDCDTRNPEREYGGHNLWLTRNGHGCGYWDGGYPEPQASRLTVAAQKLGEVYLYVGDDGKIHQES